jgi:hypothetical protein
MATQILTRKQRGDMIAPEDIEQINSSSYFVKSQAGHSGYSVTRVGQRWSCDCPDFRFRQIKCKHIHAAEAKYPPVPSWSLGLWEAQK